MLFLKLYFARPYIVLLQNTVEPTMMPSMVPSDEPTIDPTHRPSPEPTFPTKSPTLITTESESLSSTNNPQQTKKDGNNIDTTTISNQASKAYSYNFNVKCCVFCTNFFVVGLLLYMGV